MFQDSELMGDVLIGLTLLQLCGPVLLYNFFTHRLFAYMKKQHHGTWVELGAPTLFLNNSIKNTTDYLVYLTKKEWMKSDDPILIKKAKRALQWFYLSIGSMFLLSIFIWYFGRGE